jgi:hypothetical protein
MTMNNLQNNQPPDQGHPLPPLDDIDSIRAFFDAEPNLELDAYKKQLGFESYALDPSGTNLQREADGLDPMDQAAFDQWLDGLSPEDRAQLEQLKAAAKTNQDHTRKVHECLLSAVPELYEVRLPVALEARLSGLPYALGINQSMVGDIQEAIDYLQEYGGLDITGYHFDERFLMFDSDISPANEGHGLEVIDAIDKGYTGDCTIGRFVAAFPVDMPNEQSAEPISLLVNRDPDVLPGDFLVEATSDSQQQHISVNTKYIAGFIDGGGFFWANSNFLVDREFNPTRIS